MGVRELAIKDAVRKLHIPHYELSMTKPQVLKTYRSLFRELSQFPFPLFREHLRHETHDRFLAYKYVTAAPRVRALLRAADEDLEVLRRALHQKDRNAFRTVLREVYSTFEVRNSPVWRKYFRGAYYAMRRTPSTQICNTTMTYLRPQKSLAYRFNNIHLPAVSTFGAFEAASEDSEDDFYLFIRFIKKNNLLVGKNGRKLFLTVRRVYGPVGSLVTACRQTNIIRRHNADLLRDAIAPVSTRVLDHVDACLADPTYNRFVRRRLLESLKSLYSVDESGNIIRCRNFNAIR